MIDARFRTTLFGTSATITTVSDAAQARLISAHLRDLLGDHIVSVVPGAESVVTHAAAGTAADLLLDLVRGALVTVPASTPAHTKTVSLPVRYDGEDLTVVADLLGVSTEEIVSRHSCRDYEVDFLGFAPGFPYLSGVDPFLGAVERLATPRTRVPAGSVGLAAGRTCVYPTASPGGWRLLGTTAVPLFDATNTDAPALLASGDTVRFVPIR